MEKQNFYYAETPEKREQQERPVAVVNVLERNGMESIQKIEGRELSGIEAVDVDDRALRKADCPNVVFGRPHAGEYFPEDLLNRSAEGSGDTAILIDRGTDIIFRSENIPSVGTKISRFAIDPNRAPLMDANNATLTPGKVLWREDISGKPFYREGQAPSDEEVAGLVEKFYLPYYNGMMGVIGSVADRRQDKEEERVLVIDGHSFFNTRDFDAIYRDHYGMTDQQIADLPAFILSDRDGQGCDLDIREAFASALENNFNQLSEEDRGLLFENMQNKRFMDINGLFKGVHNVRFYGQREQGVNCLQLECNEDLYTDVSSDRIYKKSRYNMKKVELMKKLIERATLEVDSLLKNKK